MKLPVGTCFRDIPPLYPRPAKSFNVSWKYLLKIFSDFAINLNEDPPYQRGHVWTQEQQEKWVEYILQGGTASCEILLVTDNWNTDTPKFMELLDGKQRLTAARKFLTGELRAFGLSISEFSGLMVTPVFTFQIIEIPTRREVIELYVALNAGGTPHTQEELDKARALLDEEMSI